VTYDSQNRVQQEKLADGSTYTYAYTTNTSGQITQTSVTDRRGFVRQVNFDANGFMISDTYAVGTPQQQAFTFVRQSGTELITSITDPLGRQWAFGYDSSGNVTSFTELAGTSQAATYSYTYDPVFNNVTSITDPLNHKSSFGYDALGNGMTITDPLGHKTSLKVNSEGQPTSVTDPLGHTTTASYTFGDLAIVTDPLGRTTSQFVDAAGRAVEQTDPLGNVWLRTYDNVDQVTQLTDPLGNSTTTSYDPNENIQSITDPRGNTTYYTYTSTDQLCAVTDPLAGLSSPPTSCPTTATPHTTVYQYDPGGNLVTKIDRKGQTTSYQYDALGRPSLITYAGGSTLTPTYDLGNRLTQVVDSLAGTITRTYDGLDRLVSETDPQALGNVTCNSLLVSICYSYDAAGNRTGMTVTGQSPVTYTYDAADRLTSLTQGTGTVSGCPGITTPVTVCLVYDNANRQTTRAFPNGDTQSSTYDTANELAALTYKHGATTLGTLAYGYDLTGRRTTVSGSFARTNIPATVGAETFNADNELCWTSSGASSNGCGSPPGGATSYNYDANGNLTGNGTNTYSWNSRDELSSISGGMSASYGYDSLGRRTSTTMSGATTSYLLDGQNMVEELSGGSVTASLLDGPMVNQYYTFTAGSSQFSLLTDALGSTAALTGSTGAIQTQYTYDPFGSTTTSGTVSSNPMHYAGMQNDGGGQYFDHARYYSSLQDRFTSQDPLGCSGSEANLYQYVRDGPTGGVDPLGLSCVGTGILAGGSIATFLGAGLAFANAAALEEGAFLALLFTIPEGILFLGAGVLVVGALYEFWVCGDE
jgi:RHS repeat-associated protein